MKRAAGWVFGLLAVALVAGAAYLLLSPEAAGAVYAGWGVPQEWLDRAVLWLGVSDDDGSAHAICASGTVEADETRVAAELGGRVVEVLAGEADAVGAGELLLRLDESELVADMAVVRAGIEVAQAKLAELQSGPRPAQLEAAEAAVIQAVAQRDGAVVALDHARAQRNSPQELLAQIDDVRGQVDRLERQIEQARAAVKSAEILRDHGNPFGTDREKTEAAVYGKQVEASEERLAAAEAAQTSARSTLDALEAMQQEPLALEAQVHAAEAQVAISEAALELARAELALLEAGTRPEEVQVARAQVEEAEAALHVLEVQRDKLRLRCPRDGVVTDRLVEPGEAVIAGRPLLVVADLGRPELVVYVPTGDIGHVQLGQEVTVTVDSLADRVFSGEVTYIASEAEFTPRNVQTQEERIRTVFAVKIRLPNPDMVLKAGVPADVCF